MINHKNIRLKRWLMACLCTTAFITGACNKEVTMPDTTANARVNFYAASTAVLNGAAPPSRGYIVLLDSHDKDYDLVAMQFNSIYPYFMAPRYPDYPAYPQVNSPWLQFMEMTAGKHEILLVDTARQLLDSMQVNLDPAVPTTVFFADKLGVFSHLVLNDSFQSQPGKIGLRIINLSPTEEPLFITINKKIPALLPASTHYGDHTTFISLDQQQSETLNIKVHATDDITEFVGRTTLDVIPGHAYTLLLTGYTDNNPGTYNDPLTGKTISIAPNFTVRALKNF